MLDLENALEYTEDPNTGQATVQSIRPINHEVTQPMTAETAIQHGDGSGFWQNFKDSVSYLTNKYKQGKAPLYRGTIWNEALYGKMTTEEAQLKSNIYEATHPNLVDDVAFKDHPIRSMMGEAASIGPSMISGGIEGIGTGLAVGGVLAVGGAIAGAGVGDVVTIPGAFITGFTSGSRLGVFRNAARVEGGNAYGDLIGRGVDPKIAKAVSIPVGIANGLLEASFMGVFDSLGKKTLKELVSTEAGKKTIATLTKAYMKNVGMETGTELVQQMNTLVATGLALAVDKNPSSAHLTKEEILTSMTDTLVKTSEGMAVLGAFGVAGNVMWDRVSSIRGAKQKAPVSQTSIEVGAGSEPFKNVGGENNDQVRTNSSGGGQEALANAQDQTTPLGQGSQEQKGSGATQAQDQIVGSQEGILAQGEPSSGSSGSSSGGDNNSVVSDAQTPEGSSPLQPGSGSTMAANVEGQTTEKLTQMWNDETLTEKEKLAAMPEEKAARITKINSDIKALQAQIDARVDSAKTRYEAGKPIVQATERYAKLYREIDALQNERHDLQTNPEAVVGKKYGEVRADQIRGLITKNLKDRVNKLAEGVRAGKVIAQNSIKAIQNEVISMVKAADISSKRSAQLVDTIKNIQTPAQLERRAPWLNARLAALEEEFKAGGLRKGIEKAIERGEVKVKKGLKKGIGADAQALVDKAIRYMRMPADQLMSIKEANPDEAPMIDTFGNIKGMNSSRLQTAQDTLKALIETGKADRLVKLEEKKQAKAEKVDRIRQSIVGAKAAPKNRKLTVKQSIDRFVGNLANGMSSWPALIDTISMFDTNHVATEELDMTKPIETWKANVRSIKEGVFEKLLAASGYKNIKALWHSMTQGTEVETLGEHVTVKKIVDKQTGEEGVAYEQSALELSRNEALTWFMLMKAPGLRENITDSNGFTFEGDAPAGVSTEEAINGYLTEQDKALADEMLKFYESYYDRVNKFYREQHGVDLDKWEFYSPLVREGKLGESEFDPTISKPVTNHIANPSPFHVRTSSTARIVNVDAFDALSDHINAIEHYLAMKDKIDLINAVFRDQEIKDTITARLGPGILHDIRLATERFSLGTISAINQHLRGVERLRLRAVTSKLGGKAISAIKQAFQVFAYGTQMPLGDFFVGLAKYADPRRVKLAFKTIGETDTARLRNLGIEVSVAQALAPKRFGEIKGIHSINDYLVNFSLMGDPVSVRLGGFLVYEHVLKKTGSKEKAAEAFAKATNSTQQSANIDYQTSITGHTSMFGRLINTFVTGQRQMFELVLRASKDYYANPSKEKAAQLAKTVFLVHLSLIHI